MNSTLVVICVQLLFVLFYVLFVCKCVLPPGDNPIAVKKYINKIYINKKYINNDTVKSDRWIARSEKTPCLIFIGTLTLQAVGSS